MMDMEGIPETVLIGLTGDVMIGRLVNEKLNEEPAAKLWGDVLPLLRSTDLNLINLEVALTTSETEVSKVFNFKANPRHVEVLKEAKIDVVNLANNHVLDYDTEGLYETLTTLDQANVKHVGAGEDLDAAKRPVIMDVKGVKIGILGYTDNEPGWKATESSAGTAYMTVYDADVVIKDVQELKNQTDIVIVTLHFGPNMQERPNQSFINFAHEIADSGADIIHGHSAHIFQGIEIYRNKLILYDTGDFVDDYWVDPVLRNDRSFFFVVEVEDKKVKELLLHPTHIYHRQVLRAYGHQADYNIERIEDLSREFGTEFEHHPEGFLSCQVDH